MEKQIKSQRAIKKALLSQQRRGFFENINHRGSPQDNSLAVFQDKAGVFNGKLVSYVQRLVTSPNRLVFASDSLENKFLCFKVVATGIETVLRLDNAFKRFQFNRSLQGAVSGYI